MKMKTLITTIFLFITAFVSAQTKLDSLVFHEINLYRASFKLDTLVWSDVAFCAARKHCSYLKTMKSNDKLGTKHDTIRITHAESYLKLPIDRVKSCSDIKIDVVSECISICGYGQFFTINDKRFDYIKAAKTIVKSWRKSTVHNSILIDKKIKYGSISSIDCGKGIPGGYNVLIVY